ncbi:MAG: formylmethanofuran dehydrogenase subunit C [Rhodocyclaceae bacterium]|nr:formylmethanofuran dehydrogenase subunit C [Rhodocyclaceae bacterium]
MTTAWLLRQRSIPDLGIDFAAVSPGRVAGLTADELARTALPLGRETVELGELFEVVARGGDGPELRIEGDCRRLHGIGRGMDGGRIVVDGPVGDYLGAEMTAGEIRVDGDAGLLAACALAGGRIEIGGDVGDFAASSLPGATDGMRGGVLVVRGDAGARFGDRMRRGTAVVHGAVGDFLASRMVAGTIAVGAAVGEHPAFGMRRGTLVFAGDKPRVPDTFSPTAHDIGVFWALLARSLAPFGGAFDGLGGRLPGRVVGDLAVDGKGEWLLPA